jgi:hypothetical protein
MVNCKVLKWEHFKPGDGMMADELNSLTVEEIMKLEHDTMERNAWAVSHYVVAHIDSEPGPAGDCMKAFLTSAIEEQFFFLHTNTYTNIMPQRKRKSQSWARAPYCTQLLYLKKIDSISNSQMVAGERFHEHSIDSSVVLTLRSIPDPRKLPK